MNGNVRYMVGAILLATVVGLTAGMIFDGLCVPDEWLYLLLVMAAGYWGVDIANIIKGR